MIRIELQVSTISLSAFLSALVPIPAACLGFLIGDTMSQVTGTSLIITTVFLLITGLIPSIWSWMMIANAVITLTSFVTGVCWLVGNFSPTEFKIAFWVMVMIQVVSMAIFVTFVTTEHYVLKRFNHSTNSNTKDSTVLQTPQEKGSQQTLAPIIKAHHRSDSTLTATTHHQHHQVPKDEAPEFDNWDVTNALPIQNWNISETRIPSDSNASTATTKAASSPASNSQFLNNAGFVPSRISSATTKTTTTMTLSQYDRERLGRLMNNV